MQFNNTLPKVLCSQVHVGLYTSTVKGYVSVTLSLV